MTLRELRGLLPAFFFLFAFADVTWTLAATGSERLDGKEVFAKRCSGCHGTDTSKEGPRLGGIIGRKAGSVAGFQYSDALRSSGIVWNEDLVNKWLENPERLVKDNDMDFHVSNPDERAAVVAYLKSLSNLK
jgi:cytochrome c